MTPEQIEKCKARGITEVLQNVKATTLVVGDLFVKPESLGLPMAYSVDHDGYASLRADCGPRFEVIATGETSTARRLSDGVEFPQQLKGTETALKVVQVPWYNDERRPRTHSEGLAALSAKRKGIRRHVSWDHIKTREVSAKYPINITDGNLLVIEVWSGIPCLVVESGHVEIKFFSSWGNSLDIKPGASARVIVPYGDTKVTIDNAGSLKVEAPEQNRVRVHGPGTVTGGDFPKGVFGAILDASRQEA